MKSCNLNTRSTVREYAYATAASIGIVFICSIPASASAAAAIFNFSKQLCLVFQLVSHDHVELSDRTHPRRAARIPDEMMFLEILQSASEFG